MSSIAPMTMPKLHKEERPLATVAEHEAMLVAVCRAASVILMSRQSAQQDDAQEPLPESTIKLLKRLPRARYATDVG